MSSFERAAPTLLPAIQVTPREASAGAHPTALLKALKRRVSQLASSDKPIVLGPWTRSVAEELVYWIPFLQWVKEYGELPASRLVVISRAGARPWYGHISTQYVDILDQVS